MKTVYTGLVGDVGGTNARLALVDSTGRIRNPKTYPAQEYGSLTEVIGEYLETTVGRQKLHTAAIAVAGPVVGALPVGPGRLVICQYRLAEPARRGDPAARAILADLLAWTAGGAR